jgi:hypothetical protein
VVHFGYKRGNCQVALLSWRVESQPSRVPAQPPQSVPRYRSESCLLLRTLLTLLTDVAVTLVVQNLYRKQHRNYLVRNGMLGADVLRRGRDGSGRPDCE